MNVNDNFTDDHRIFRKTVRDFVEKEMLEVVELPLEGEERPLQAEIDSFLTAVRDGTTPEVTGEDGRRALELADRIVAQLASQTW